MNQISYSFLTLYRLEFKNDNFRSCFRWIHNLNLIFSVSHSGHSNLLDHREGLWAGCQHMSEEATLCLLQIPRCTKNQQIAEIAVGITVFVYK